MTVKYHAMKHRLFIKRIGKSFFERDLLFIGLNKKTAFNFVAQDLQKDTTANGLRSQYIYRNPTTGKSIRNRVDCTHDFEMILIGKDMGVKARWTKGFTQEDLRLYTVRSVQSNRCHADAAI
jgi:hypothetical protein